MRFCNTLQDYESAKNQGTITDDLFVVILQDKLAKFKGQTFDWSQNADLTALATKGELEALAEEIASNERVWAEALNDLNERINNIGTGGGGGGGTSDIVVDAALSTTSTNAIQNKAVANALNEKADASALASKQDTLVSGTNIKTVQGQSILGSGNISISVPTVDAELSSTSTNAVQNKVVKAEIDKKQDGISDLETIRSGAAKGTTAVQPDVISNQIANLYDVLFESNVDVDEYNSAIIYQSTEAGKVAITINADGLTQGYINSVYAYFSEGGYVNLANSLNWAKGTHFLFTELDKPVARFAVLLKNGKIGDKVFASVAALKIVNNLTDGGENVALSAEQGKVLDEKLAELSSSNSEMFSGQLLEKGAWDASGNDIDNDIVAKSNYFPIKNGDVVSGYIYRISLYDSKLQSIEDIYTEDSNSYGEYTISSSQCAYARILVRIRFITNPVLINGVNSIGYSIDKAFWRFYSKEFPQLTSKAEEVQDELTKAQIQVDKIDGIIPYANMVEKENLLNGYYISGADGVLKGEGTNEYFCATPFLLIKAHTTYYCGYVFSQSAYMSFYSLQKEFLSETSAKFIYEDSSLHMKIIGGDEDVFARLSILKESVENAYISRFYDEKKDREVDYSLSCPSLNEEVKKINNTLGGFNFSINLLDKNALTSKSYVNASGNVVNSQSTTFNATPFILLQPNSIYHIRGIYTQGLYAFYDKNKIVQDASSLGVNIEYDTHTTPANYHAHIFTGAEAVYFRGSVEDSYINTCYVSRFVDAYYPPGEIPYEEYYSLALNSLKLKRRNVLVIGDSISTDNYGNYPKWVTALKNIAFLPYTTNNNSVHATGYVANYQNSYENFITRVEGVENKDSYDLVLIFGGVNDFIQNVPIGTIEDNKSTHFLPAVEYLFKYLIENFTNARIGVILPLKSYNLNANSSGHYLTDYANCISEVAKKYCYPILNLTENSGFCPYISSFSNRWTLTEYIGGDGNTGDGLHPNEEYEKRFLAPMIQSFISSIL